MVMAAILTVHRLVSCALILAFLLSNTSTAYSHMDTTPPVNNHNVVVVVVVVVVGVVPTLTLPYCAAQWSEVLLPTSMSFKSAPREQRNWEEERDHTTIKTHVPASRPSITHACHHRNGGHNPPAKTSPSFMVCFLLPPALLPFPIVQPTSKVFSDRVRR